MTYQVFTDGSSSRKRGSIGTSYIVFKNRESEPIRTFCKGFKDEQARNGIAELLGVYYFLRDLCVTEDLYIEEKSEIVIYSDSQYVVNEFTEWFRNQMMKNFFDTKNKEIIITKTWVSDGTVYQPDSISVSIYADGEYLYDIIITKDMNWTYVLNNLPKYKDGKEINYTIKEKQVDGYTTTYDGYNIINTMIPVEKGEIVPPKTGINNTNNGDLLYLILSTVGAISLGFSFKKKYNN